MRVLLATGEMRPEPGGVPLTSAENSLSAGEVAAALARGWQAERPSDELRTLPMPDGGARSFAVISGLEKLSESLWFLPAQGPGLVATSGSGASVTEGSSLRPGDAAGLRATDAAGSRSAEGTYLLDAAAALELPADTAEARSHALEGSSAPIGDLLADALLQVPAGARLVVGMSRSAVHDGGRGCWEALTVRLGDAAAVRGLLAERDVLLAISDDAALTGISGAGQALQATAGLRAEEAQERDREAASWASRWSRALVDDAGVQTGGQKGDEVAESSADTETALQTSVGASRVVPGHSLLAEPAAPVTPSAWGTGAGGGASFVLQTLDARAFPGARLMAQTLALGVRMDGIDLVITSVGEAYGLLSDGVPAVVGEMAAERALPAILVTGRSILPRGELAGAGLSTSYSLEDRGVHGSWNESREQLTALLESMGARLARSWSR